MKRVVKPRNKAAKRALEDQEPKAIENTKETLFISGGKVGQQCQTALKDLASLKKPFCSSYSRKNVDIRPFEDITPVETFLKKENKSMFVFANHNKKRPENLIFGRTYDYRLLDMFEFGLTHFKSMSEFKTDKIAVGTKPCLTFSGQAFDSNDEMKRLKSMFIDFFRGPEVTHVRLAGLEHTIQFTALDEKTIAIRSYRICLKKSSTPKVPRIELEEIGPQMDLTLRRTHIASEDLTKLASRQVKNVYKEKKTKNISKDELGNVFGQVHFPSQDISQLQTRKMKGLKKEKKTKSEDVAEIFGEDEKSESEDENDSDAEEMEVDESGSDNS